MVTTSRTCARCTNYDISWPSPMQIRLFVCMCQKRRNLSIYMMKLNIGLHRVSYSSLYHHNSNLVLKGKIRLGQYCSRFHSKIFKVCNEDGRQTRIYESQSLQVRDCFAGLLAEWTGSHQRISSFDIWAKPRKVEHLVSLLKTDSYDIEKDWSDMKHCWELCNSRKYAKIWMISRMNWLSRVSYLISGSRRSPLSHSRW